MITYSWSYNNDVYGLWSRILKKAHDFNVFQVSTSHVCFYILRQIYWSEN